MSYVHFDARNVVSEHGSWVVTYQGIAAREYALFYSADMLFIIDENAVAHLGYVNLDDFNAALAAGRDYHGTAEEREEEAVEEAETTRQERAEDNYETLADDIETEEDSSGDDVQIEDMTVAELRAYADEHNIDLPSRAKRQELIDIINESDKS